MNETLRIWSFLFLSMFLQWLFLRILFDGFELRAVAFLARAAVFLRAFTRKGVFYVRSFQGAFGRQCAGRGVSSRVVRGASHRRD